MISVSDISKSFNTAAEDEESDSVMILTLVLRGNQVFAINGDQNMFVYQIKTKDSEVRKLSLDWSVCLYLDEIIDAKFVNKNTHAILCSNSETMKLIEIATGKTEIYPGHSDIIISLDVFKSFCPGAKFCPKEIIGTNNKAKRKFFIAMVLRFSNIE